ncbi:MAG: hypothetical protein Q9188_000226 [Gyalolechia gomerana]
MDEDISPTASRATTPSPDELNMTERQWNMDTITELSNRFQQHRLGSYAHEIDPAALSPLALDIEPPTLPLRASRRRSSSLPIRQQRRNMSRRQCTPTHLSQISRLVEELSQDVNPCYNATHPSSQYRSSVSPTSNPPSFNSLESTSSSSSGSEDSGCDHDSLSRRLVANKVSKESRRGATVDASERRQQKLVPKKVRIRKSLVRLRTAASVGR